MIKVALSFVRTYLWELADSKMTQTSVLILTMKSIAQEAERRAAAGPLRSLMLRIDVHGGIIGTIPERTSLIVRYGNMIAGLIRGTIPEWTSLRSALQFHFGGGNPQCQGYVFAPPLQLTQSDQSESKG